MRAERVAEEIKRKISQIIFEDLRDPRIGFVTITDVDVSPDLRQAKVYFSVLGDKAQERKTLKVLNGACGFIRKLVGEHLAMRFNPEINFKLDISISRAIEIEEKLKEIKDEKKKES